MNGRLKDLELEVQGPKIWRLRFKKKLCIEKEKEKEN